MSVYPFNEFEYIISTLLGADALPDDYYELRDEYIAVISTCISLKSVHRGV